MRVFNDATEEDETYGTYPTRETKEEPLLPLPLGGDCAGPDVSELGRSQQRFM